MPLITTLYQRYLFELDASMRGVVNSQSGQPDDFAVMLRYAMGWVDESDQPYSLPTGKRIRPILLLVCTEACGGDWHTALPAAAAVELLHNFSLIHDDIQDNSPIRHNRPALWKIWGMANAINAGDAIFALAYTALANLQKTTLKTSQIVSIWGIFNQTVLELTRGQHLDMRFERQATIEVNEYVSMIRGKSAALIAACAQIGALVATNSSSTASRFKEFGLNLGTAFQIHDDILGIWGNPAVTGKSTATDILSRKKSLPVLYGLEKSAALRSIYQQDVLSELDVQEAVALLSEVGAQDYARQEEANYLQQAHALLEQTNLQDEPAAWLDQIIADLFYRHH
jgi:geranylgeranyl diphosphate synthase type I